MSPTEESFDTALFDDAKEQAEFEKTFNKAKNAPPGPIGTFQVNIVDAILERSQSSNRRQIHWELVILVGKDKDITVHKYDGLDSPKQITMTCNDIKKLGINVDKLTLATLPAILSSLKGKTAMITTKQNKEYYNIYFQRLVTGSPVAPSGTDKKKF